MDSKQQLSTRIEGYLKQLLDTNARWSQWLRLGESATVSLDRSTLTAFEQQATAISEDLKRAVEARQQLLNEAAAIGIPAANISALVRSLPIWQRPGFRGAFERARMQLDYLRRVHVSAFILIHQSLQHSRETLRLMSSGSGPSPVYNSSEPPDSGGQLLDAAL